MDTINDDGGHSSEQTSDSEESCSTNSNSSSTKEIEEIVDKLKKKRSGFFDSDSMDVATYVMNFPSVEGHNTSAPKTSFFREKTAEEIFGLTNKLTSIQFFSQFNKNDFARFAQAMTFRTLQRNQSIFFNDISDNSLFVVLSGELQVGNVRTAFSTGDTIGFRQKKRTKQTTPTSSQASPTQSIIAKPLPVPSPKPTKAPRRTQFTRRNSLSTALTKEQSCTAKSRVLMAEIPHSVCAKVFASIDKQIVFAPTASRRILEEIEPKDRNDAECSIVIELLKTIKYLHNSSNDMKRILAKHFRMARVCKGDVLSSFIGTANDVIRHCDFFIVPIQGTLALHKSTSVKDVNSEEDLVPTSSNKRKIISQGEAFPNEDMYTSSLSALEKRRVAEDDGGALLTTSGKKIKFAVVGHSVIADILFLPLPTMNSIMNSNVDFNFNVENCRVLAKIPPNERTETDINLLYSYCKPHVFFEQLTEQGGKAIAKEMKIGFLEEGNILVGDGEVLNQFYIVLNGSCHIFQGAYHPKSPVVDNLESGDVFGTQLMLRQRPSPFTIRLMEPSEFLIVSEDSYRVIMNCGGGSVRRVDIRSWRTDFESNLESSIFKSCPPSFKRKLSSFVTFRHIDQHTNLNLTDGLHFLLLDGSVSLHRRLEGKHLRGATPPLLSEKERSKNMSHCGMISNDIESKATRKWWKRNETGGAELVVDKGTFLGDLTNSGQFGFPNYYAFTREKCCVCELDAAKIIDYPVNSTTMLKVQSQLKNLYDNDFSRLSVDLIQQLFKENPLTKAFKAGLVLRLSKIAKVRSFSKGEEIQHDCFGIVVEGIVEIRLRNKVPCLRRVEDGVEDICCVGFLTKTDWFGDEALNENDDENENENENENFYKLFAGEATKIITISKIEFQRALNWVRFIAELKVPEKMKAKEKEKEKAESEIQIKSAVEAYSQIHTDELGESAFFITQKQVENPPAPATAAQPRNGSIWESLELRINLESPRFNNKLALVFSPIATQNRQILELQDVDDEMEIDNDEGNKNGRNLYTNYDNRDVGEPVHPIELLTNRGLRNPDSNNKYIKTQSFQTSSHRKGGRSLTYNLMVKDESMYSRGGSSMMSTSSFASRPNTESATASRGMQPAAGMGMGMGIRYTSTLPSFGSRQTPAHVRVMKKERMDRTFY